MTNIKTNLDFIHPSIEFDALEGLKQIKAIKKGEKIIESKNLAKILKMEDKIPDFTMIAEPQRKKHNIQFSDKNTLVALRDIEVGEKLVAYYPQRMKKWITAPNMFVYYLAQF